MKNSTWLVIAILIINSVSSFTQIQVGQDINGEAADDWSGGSVSISGDGTRIAIGAFTNDGNGTNSGHVRIFLATNGNWTQIGQDIDGEANSDLSGTAVSISADGKRVAIGAPQNDDAASNSGQVRIYQEIGGSWIQIGQDINGDLFGDSFGYSVSISSNGKKVAIGAYLNDDNGADAGKARIYEELNGIWTQIGQDILGEAANDNAGKVVSISPDGTRVVIGAPTNANNGFFSGHARIFEEINGSWIQVGQAIEGDAIGDFCGNSVSLSADGKIAAIAALYNGSNGFQSGQVRVFQESGGNWSQIGQNINGQAVEERSGFSISLSADGNSLAIGARLNDDNGADAGQVRIYRNINGVWTQLGQEINGVAPGDWTGYSVSLSADGSRLGIGAPRNSNNALDAGHARVFVLKGTIGSVFFDQNLNCSKEAGEIGLMSIPLLINPGNYTVQTDSAGLWFLDLPPNNYTITVDTSGLWTTACVVPQNFTVSNSDTLTMAPLLGLHGKYPCPSPDVSIYMPFIRRCFTDQIIRVKACNTILATETLHNAMVVVTLDSLINPTSFELPHIDLGNNQFQFDLGTLLPNRCVDFWIKATVNCGAPNGSALCVQAEIFPVAPCVLDSIPNPHPPTVEPCLGEWDESSLIVEGYCDNGMVIFEITNIGIGNMVCYSPVTVYIDGVLYLIDSLKLNSQQSVSFPFASSGESWHLEVAQHPYHPGNSQPKATVENCGGFLGQTKINLFAQDDADPVIDIYCGEVTGSYDPNDKTGYPIGISNHHFIDANQQIQYRIRFQNTGNDTAFTVVIRDTLDTDLNIFSLQSGISSHHYSFRIYGQRILEWTFNDIMLPDSNVNEPASHGFVTFKVDQELNLPEGTQITNSVGIYFDFNAPIITNTTLHTIYYPFTEDCQTIIDGPNTICGAIAENPGHPLSDLDCDGDGVTNITECIDTTIPEDPCDYETTSITLPVTADQSGCQPECPDLTSIISILPGNISGTSNVGFAVEVAELNQFDTDGTLISVRIPSDPRLTFTWDSTLTTAALVNVDNTNWNYIGNNGLFHTFHYLGVMTGGTRTAFGVNSSYDPQGTQGQTTITSTVVPTSGGECQFSNNSDSEILVYFD